MLWQPHKYQLKALEFMLQSGSGQLWLDPGMGKTAISLQTISTLKDVGAPAKALIVAPIRPMYAVWPAEIAKWSNFNDLTYQILHGPQKDDTFNSDYDPDITLINFDGLAWLLRHHKVNRLKFDILIVDEISYLRNTQTKRFKAMKDMLGSFRRRYGLTGSPSPNSLMDIFGPQFIIDRGATFGTYITHFRTKYFYPSGYGGYEWKLQAGAEQSIYDALDGKVLRLNAEDYLDMPEIRENNILVDLPPPAQKKYKEMEDDLIIQIQDKLITASNAAVAIGKCQQLANGAIYDANDDIVPVHSAKLDAVQDLVNDLFDKPCLIAYHYRHDLHQLKKIFPDAPVLGSGVTGNDLNKIVNDWNRGMTPVLLCHPQSAGHGLNLQGAGHAVIWFSNTWSYERYDQFNRRLWRQGQRNDITVHRIIARKTIDEAIIAAIRHKHGGQKALMDALSDYVT